MWRILVMCVLGSVLVACENKQVSEKPLVQARVDRSVPEAFQTIQAALDAAPANTSQPYRIAIAAGDYYEKLVIDKPNILLVGENTHNTRIYYDAYAGQEVNGKTWGTSGSGTIVVRAPRVQLQHLTVENSFDFLANDALAEDDPARIQHSQSVALHLDVGSDYFIGRELRLLSYHDTLFVNAGRSWFDRSLIAGNVDYIFGSGNALFTESEIKTLGRIKQAIPRGYVTAPSTHIDSNFGLTFINCKLTRAADVPDNSIPLGRPWQPTTDFSDGRYADPKAIGKTVFINTWMDAHITRDGWYAMNGTAKDGTRVPFPPEKARFFEYKSQGPGAHINDKRPQLSEAEAAQYSALGMLRDW